MASLQEHNVTVNWDSLTNPTKRVLIRFMGDGGLLEETAPVNSCEISISAKQAQDLGIPSIAVKTHNCDLTLAINEAEAAVRDLAERFKVKPV